MRPVLKIIGEDGNAFAILGKAEKAMKDAGWDEKGIEKVMKEAMAGDYDHLLQTICKYFEVR